MCDVNTLCGQENINTQSQRNDDAKIYEAGLITTMTTGSLLLFYAFMYICSPWLGGQQVIKDARFFNRWWLLSVLVVLLLVMFSGGIMSVVGAHNRQLGQVPENPKEACERQPFTTFETRATFALLCVMILGGLWAVIVLEQQGSYIQQNAIQMDPTDFQNKWTVQKLALGSAFPLMTIVTTVAMSAVLYDRGVEPETCSQ